MELEPNLRFPLIAVPVSWADFYGVSRKPSNKPVLHAHATVCLFQAFVEGTGLSRFLGSCYDEFGCEIFSDFLLAVY